MPELADVEYYRKQWQCGVKQKVLAVESHAHSRVLRGVDSTAMSKALMGAVLTDSESHGKQMFFRFSGNVWLGLHLGMTGKLLVEDGAFKSGRHDHLVLRQNGQSLVFNDPRQFGRVRFHAGDGVPSWRANLPPQILSKQFTRDWMERFLAWHRRREIKAALLMQDGFPGIGNWMADEILWRAKIHPGERVEKLSADAIARIFREARFVCREAMRTVGVDFRDPPAKWLFHVRWRKGGQCPRDGGALSRAEIGGRTSCWCPSCQPQ
jgi:formamidopyrimidine-DNA glycosylase